MIRPEACISKINVRSRDAHFPTGNRETGNQGPGNFPREMGDREKSGNREKIAYF